MSEHLPQITARCFLTNGAIFMNASGVMKELSFQYNSANIFEVLRHTDLDVLRNLMIEDARLKLNQYLSTIFGEVMKSADEQITAQLKSILGIKDPVAEVVPEAREDIPAIEAPAPETVQ